MAQYKSNVTIEQTIICNTAPHKQKKTSVTKPRLGPILGRVKSQNLSKHGVENAVAMATCDTLDAKVFQNLVLQYTLVKVATFCRYCLNIKEVLES